MTMFSFTKANAGRAVLAAAAMALFAASHTAMAQPRKEISYWADATVAARADHGVSTQLASQAGDRKDGAAAQLASRAGEREDGTGTGQYAARATVETTRLA